MSPLRRVGAAILVLITISLLPIPAGRLSAETVAHHVTHSPARHHSSTTQLRAPKDSLPATTALQRWVNSPAVRCILLHESTTINGVTLNPLAHNNRYQFESNQWTITTGLTGPPGSYSSAVQDAAAYSLWRSRKYEPWAADDEWCKRYE